VLIGRSYNTCDPGANLNLPAKIRDLGVHAVPMDFLPLQSVDLSGIENMYWRSGQKILAAAKIIKEHPDLYPVYITNFGCGPDSFISHFFRKEMDGKPFLQLEIDEHSADTGAITRIEAFLDSLKSGEGKKGQKTFSVRSNGPGHRRKVLLPAMADHAHVIAAAFQACGVEAEVLPESDQDTIIIGKEHSSGRECYPLALTTGDMIKALRRPGFDPDRTAFFMPTGKGPCRFGQYNRLHRLVLDRLGFEGVPILSPSQDETLYRDGGSIGKDFIRLCWQGSLAVDMLQKALHEHRPYEKRKGGADVVYEKALRDLAKAIATRTNPVPVMRQAYRELTDIAGSERNKPVIGIVGEIYIRGNRFGNENVIGQIEKLGGEAWLAPLSEWLLYLNATAKVSARMNRSWKDLLKASLTHWVQMRDEHRFLDAFNGTLRSLHEPRIEETMAMALPYIHHSFEGEAVLSVGKAIDFINRGVSGVVNVMPFSCMPGTITSAILKRVREDFGTIPFLNIAYEGQQDTQTLTRLEAFMHQAKAYRSMSDTA
jgi:predicted nucleotide-binding protein (sugar kinase/HSP70/actin superfamily)